MAARTRWKRIVSGMKYMVKAGYNPESIGNVFTMFQAGEKFERQRAAEEGREPRLYHGVFSSHPSPDEREVQAAKGAANIKDAPPEGWLERHDEYLTDHQRHRLWVEQGAGRRARQPVLSRGHGHHGGVSARLDHREPARPPARVHAEERRDHADHDRREARQAGAARIPAHQAERTIHVQGRAVHHRGRRGLHGRGAHRIAHRQRHWASALGSHLSRPERIHFRGRKPLGTATECRRSTASSSRRR